jgi:DMSO reductase anchor subunit
VAFTLIAQGVVGAFVGLVSLKTAGVAPGTGITGTLLVLMSALLGYGLFTSTMHLGRPKYFYRAMNNLRYSWVSREILFVGGFMTLLLGYTGATVFGLLPDFILALLGWISVGFGVVGIYCMVRIYRIPARPFWDHTNTNIAFFKSGLILGPLSLALALGFATALGDGELFEGAYRALLGVALLASLFGHMASRRQEQDMARTGGEAAASLDRLTGDYGRFRQVRQKLSLGLIGVLCFGLLAGLSGWAMALVIGALLLAVAGDAIERSLFYLLVIPTTMPGAMFLKNTGFEQLARDTGLAENRAVGVVSDTH